MDLVYIHGANATADSFNYLRPELGNGTVLSYDSRMGFRNNLDRLLEEMAGLHDVVFIAHSLGGVYALHLADLLSDRVKGGITMSTPYGGHHVAMMAKILMPFDQLLHDIGPNSWPMDRLNKVDIRWPWCNIVTTKGNVPWVNSPNDGVVTIDSQKHLAGMDFVEIGINHYEVVISPMVVSIIRSRIDQL